LQYGIGESIVKDIFKQKDKLMKFETASNNYSAMKIRKIMKTSTYEELDETFLQWISQLSSEETPILGPIITTKAKHGSLKC